MTQTINTVGAGDPQSYAEARRGLPDVRPTESVLWRPLRCLLDEGSPTQPTTVMFVDLGAGYWVPFASACVTKNQRLVLWPAVDSEAIAENEEGGRMNIHHLTLELSNGTTHATSYRAGEKSTHRSLDWKLQRVAKGLDLWLLMGFARRALERQVGAVEQSVKMPNSDAARRTEEYRRYASSMRSANLQTPPLRGDSILISMSLIDLETASPESLGPETLPLGTWCDKWITGWPEGDIFQIAKTIVKVGDLNLLVAVAAPLGRALVEVQFGGACRA